MSDWGPHCVNCGHPSTYHGPQFCQATVGADRKRSCDCDVYLHPMIAAAVLADPVSAPAVALPEEPQPTEKRGE